MRVFKHLNFTDRLRIEKWKKEGMRTREIAEKLRVDPSTVYRELKRGSYDRLDGKTWEMIPTYSPDIAEQRYQANLREKGPDLKIGKDHELAAYIEQTIIEKACSPAAVYGYAMEEGRTFKTHISVPTIYSYIKKGVFLNLTQVALPRHGVHKNEYKKVKKKEPARAPAGESIDKRPEEIQSREAEISKIPLFLARYLYYNRGYRWVAQGRNRARNSLFGGVIRPQTPPQMKKPQRKAPQRAGFGTGTPGNTPFCPGVPADTRRKEPQNPVQSEDRRW